MTFVDRQGDRRRAASPGKAALRRGDAGQVFPLTKDIKRRAQAVAAIAAAHAVAVDGEARFPSEAFSAVRGRSSAGCQRYPVRRLELRVHAGEGARCSLCARGRGRDDPRE